MGEACTSCRFVLLTLIAAASINSLIRPPFPTGLS